MKKVLLISVILILQLLVQQSHQEDYVHCQYDDKLERTKLFTSILEKRDNYLSKFIKGFNLNFELDFEQHQKPAVVNTFKIKQGIQELEDRNVFVDDYRFVIGSSVIQQADQVVHTAVLVKNIEGKMKVRFGYSLPYTKTLFDTDISIEADSSITCFGVTLITSTVGVVDCVKYMGGSLAHPYANYYYIVSKLGNHKKEFERLFDLYNYQNPLGRKTLRYDTSHKDFQQIFLVQGIPFDDDHGEPEETFLQIHRFISDPSQEHNGKLISEMPITGATLGFDEPLKLAGFDIAGDIIYVLDHNHGAKFFRYRANTVQVLGGMFTESSARARRWGISAHVLGSITQVIIATSSELIEYHKYHEKDEGFKVASYHIENPLVGTIGIEANQDYILLKQGKMVVVYDKGVEEKEFTKGILYSVQSMHLFFTNTIQVYHVDDIALYQIQEPSIWIHAKDDEPVLTLLIKATSTNFNNEQVCNYKLVSEVIPYADDQSVYYTNYPYDIQWSYQSSTFTNLPLEKHYIGPNLHYHVGVVHEDPQQNKIAVKEYDEQYYIQQKMKSKYSSFLQNKIKDDGDAYLFIQSIPRKANVHIKDTTQWSWTEVVSSTFSFKDSFYSLHLNSEKNMVIYLCEPWNNDNPMSVACGEPIATIDVGSDIQAYSTGTWSSYQNIVAFTPENRSGQIKMHTLYSSFHQPPGHLIDEIDFNEQFADWGLSRKKVISFEIQANALYAVLESGTKRIIQILANEIDLQPVSRITEDDYHSWPGQSTRVWAPESVLTNPSHPNVLFITNGEQIIVVSIESHTPRYLSLVAPYNTQIGVQVFITPHSLVVTQADNSIVDYSLEELYDLNQEDEFRYPTYEYKFLQPFSISHSEITGMIYVMAKDRQNNLKLLVYRTGVEAIRTLYKVVDIEDNVTIDPKKIVSISAGGSKDVDFIFIQYNGKKFYCRSPLNPSIYLVPMINDASEYVNFVEISLDIKPMKGQTQNIQDNISLVNGQTKIIVNEDIIQESVPSIVYGNDENQTYKLDISNWYEGSVVDIGMTCNPEPTTCGSNIKLQNVVHPNPDYDDDKAETSVVDMLHVEDSVFVLKRDPNDPLYYAIHVLSKDLKHEKVWNRFKPNLMNGVCRYMTPMYDEDDLFQHIIVLCEDEGAGLWGTMIIEDDISGGEPHLGDDGEIEQVDDNIYLLQDVTHVNRGQYQYFYNALFINNESDNRQAGIKIFSLKKEYTFDRHFGQFTLYFNQLMNIVTGSDLDLHTYKFTTFSVSYETKQLVRHEHKYLKLFLVNSRPGVDTNPTLFFLDLNIEDDSYDIVEDTIFPLDLIQFIGDIHHQFINEQTHVIKYITMDIEEQPQGNQDIVIYHGLLLTDNTAVYQMELVFEIDKTAITEPLQYHEQLSSVTNIYNNYGRWELLPQAHYLRNTLSLAFRNDGQITIALYDIQTFIKNQTDPVSFMQHTASEKVPLHTMKGGVKLRQGAFAIDDQPIVFALYDNNQYGTALLTTDMSEDSKLKTYNYSPDEIVVSTEGDFEEQEVIFTFNNDVGRDRPKVFRKINPHSKPEPIVPTKTKGFPVWAIILIVIMSLILLGLLGFFIYKKKFAANNDGLFQTNSSTKLLNKSQDTGTKEYSLQETPTRA